jgi:nitrous oxidase accessory protein NosD
MVKLIAMLSKALVAVLVLGLLFFPIGLFCDKPVSAQSSKTITVPNDYLTIQAAVRSASPGDTVFVKSGSYTGGIAINKPLTLKGENSKTTMIIGGASLQDIVGTLAATQNTYSRALASSAISLTNNAVRTLDSGKSGFQIQPANFIPPPTFGVYINSSDVSISGFTIQGGNDAIYAGGFDRLQISQNILGSCVLGGNNITVANNTGVGLQIGGSHNLVLGNSGGLVLVSSNSTILENSLGGFALQNANFNIIAKNTLTGSNMGLWIGSNLASGPPECSYNLFERNKMEKCGLWGILMGAGSYNVFFGNIVENTGVGIGHDGYGLALGGNHRTAENNLFFHNSFINNAKNFGVNWDVLGSNSFDNGAEGNYWDDYLVKYPAAQKVDQSATGNTPYFLISGNTDNHPLLSQPTLPENVALPEPWAFLVPTAPNPSPDGTLTPIPSPTLTATPTTPPSTPSPSSPSNQNTPTVTYQPPLTYSPSPETAAPPPSLKPSPSAFPDLETPPSMLPISTETPSPSIPECPTWLILPLAFVMVAVALGLKKVKVKR